jgi:hypothetical protein
LSEVLPALRRSNRLGNCPHARRIGNEHTFRLLSATLAG